MYALLNTIAAIPLESTWTVGLWVVCAVLLLLVGFIINLFGLAGNWLMVGVTVIHYFLVPPDLRVAYPLSLVLAVVALALLGEGLEFLSGILGAGKAGGSRRAMMLSMIGGMAGSLFGFGLGNAVVPIIGGIIGIFLVGGLGSLAGAMLGERWKGSGPVKQRQVGKGAFWGRILGTLAKTLVGSIMLILSLVAFVV